MKLPVKAEKRNDGYWYIVDSEGFALLCVQGPPRHEHEEIAVITTKVLNREADNLSKTG